MTRPFENLDITGSADSIIWGILAAIGISVAGFALGLNKLVWALWAAVSAIWILVWLNVGQGKHGDAEILYFGFPGSSNVGRL
jgi:hypothetical protein